MSVKDYFNEDYWNVGIIDKSIDLILSDETFFNDITLIKTPGSFFLADPFWSPSLDKNSFFCERFNFNDQRGIISKIRLDDTNQIQKLEDLSLGDKHLSFPFLFEENGVINLIPENAESGNLNCWDLNNIENKKILLNKSVIDPIIFIDNGYWLFCSIYDGSENTSTHLYYSDKLEDEWIEHQDSPICKSSDGARMAGNILVIGDKKYRLGQDCSETYGGGVTIFEITELNKNAYHEESVMTIKPPINFIGIHTLNTFGNKTIIDLKTNKPSIKKPFQRFKKKFL